MPLPSGWRFKYCVFDADGVLLNSRLLAKKTFGRFLESEYGIPAPAALVFYTRTPDLPLAGKFRRLFEDRRLPSGDLEVVVARFEESLETETPVVYEGAREVLEALQEKGVLLGAAGASSGEEIRSRLKRAGLLTHFHAVVGKEEGRKGGSQMEALACRLGVPLEDFVGRGIYFTASPREVREVSARGMAAAGVAHLASPRELSESGAPVVLRYIGELLSF